MLDFFTEKQQEEIVKHIAEDMKVEAEDIYTDEDIIMKYLDKKLSGEEEEFVNFAKEG